MKCTVKKCNSLPTEVAWLASCLGLTLVAFLCSLLAVLDNDWFHMYCVGESGQTTSLTYRFGLWSFCGDDLTWVEGVNTTEYSCVSIDHLVSAEPQTPSWLQGTRAFEVSGCVACGTTALLMLASLALPSDESLTTSTGFTVANLTSAIFFTGSLLTVFAVQMRPWTLVPPSVCSLHSMPSAYAVTLTAVAIGACTFSSFLAGIVSEVFVNSQPAKRGRKVREVEN